MKVLRIPNRTKVSKKEYDNYLKSIEDRVLTEQDKTNYKLYNTKL